MAEQSPDPIFANVVKFGKLQRSIGRQEALIAVARMLQQRGAPDQAQAALQIKVSDFLTPEEIARGDEIPRM